MGSDGHDAPAGAPLTLGTAARRLTARSLNVGSVTPAGLGGLLSRSADSGVRAPEHCCSLVILSVTAEVVMLAHPSFAHDDRPCWMSVSVVCSASHAGQRSPDRQLLCEARDRRGAPGLDPPRTALAARHEGASRRRRLQSVVPLDGTPHGTTLAAHDRNKATVENTWTLMKSDHASSCRATDASPGNAGLFTCRARRLLDNEIEKRR